MRIGRALFALGSGCAATLLIAACLFPSLDDLEGGQADSAVVTPSAESGADAFIPNDADAADTFVPVSPSDCDAAVAIWPMNEGTGSTIHDCKGLYPGLLGAGTSWTTDGGGVLFDGGFITFGNPNPTPLLLVGGVDTTPASFTASAHVYVTNPGTTGLRILLGRLTTPGPAWALTIFREGDDLHAAVGIRTPSFDRDGGAFALSSIARWIHVATTFEVTTRTFTFYLDGASTGAAVVPPDSFQPGNAPFEIGGSESNAAAGVFGAIRDVRLYDRALLPSEIQTIAAAP